MGFESFKDAFDHFDDFTRYKFKLIFNQINNESEIQSAINSYQATFPEFKKRDERIPQCYAKELPDKTLEEIAVKTDLFLQDARELYRMARNANRATSTLFYYSWHSFFAFLIFTFLRFDQSSKSHGMTVNPMEIDNFNVNIFKKKENGFLMRILDLFTILGYPICFSDILPIHTNEGIVFQKNDISSLTKRTINIRDINNFDVDEFMRAYTNKHVKHERTADIHTNQKIRLLNNSMISYVYLFVASNYERYRPHYLSTILDASTKFGSDFRTRLYKAYKDYLVFIRFAHNEINKPRF